MSATLREPTRMSLLAAETWHRTLSQTDGRDKLFRLIQYVCKLIRGLDAGRGTPHPDAPVAKVAALESALATARQIWRLFKWASVYAKSKQRLTSSLSGRVAPSPPDVTAIFAEVSMFGYYLCDNVTFAHKIKLLQGDIRSSTRRAARFWLAAILAGLGGSVHKVLTLHRQQQELKAQMLRVGRQKKEDEGQEASGESETLECNVRREYLAVLRQKRAATAVVAKHSGDVMVAWSLTRQEQLHPAVVGGCGVVSSLVGFWQLWPKYLPTE